MNLIDFKIQNVVGTCDMGFRVLVEELSFAHSDRCTVRILSFFFLPISITGIQIDHFEMCH